MDNDCGLDLSADDRYLEMQFNIDDRSDDADPLGGSSAPVDWARLETISDELLAETRDISVYSWSLVIQSRIGDFASYISALERFAHAVDRDGPEMFPQGFDEHDTGEHHCNAAVTAFGQAAITVLMSMRLRSGRGTRLGDVIETEKSEDVSSCVSDISGWISEVPEDSENSPLQLVDRFEVALNSLRAYFDNQSSASAYLLLWDRIFILGKRLRSSFVKNTEMLGDDPDTRDADKTGFNIDSEGTSENTEQHEKITSVRTREDARRAISTVIEYFERYEPSHPAPILLRRAQRFVGMGFEEIVNDMLPHALDSLRQISGEGHSQ